MVLHAGNLGFLRRLGHVAASREILQQRKHRLRVHRRRREPRGAGVFAAGLAKYYDLLPFRPVEQIPHVMMAGDFHIVTVRRGLEGVVVPSKLYSILAAGRPVLAVAPPESDAARIVVESGCGIAADPDDPAAVAAAIKELRAISRTAGRNGPPRAGNSGQIC